MPSATIRYNEDYSEYEVVLPDGTHLAAEPMPEDGIQIIEHPEDSKLNFLAVLSTYDDEESNLEPNTVYLLAPVITAVLPSSFPLTCQWALSAPGS